MNTRHWIVLISMCFMSFSTLVTFSVIAPFFPGVAIDKGASVAQVGFIFGSYFIGMSVGSIIFGNTISHIGPKFVYVMGMFVRSVTYILFGFLVFSPDGTSFIALCFVCRIVESLGSAAFMTAMYVIIAREFPDKVALMFGIITTFNGVGLMSGPPIGGVLYDIGGFTFPFLTLGSAMLVVVVISVYVIPAIADSAVDSRSEYERKPWMYVLLRNPTTVLNMICAMLVYGPINFIEISLEQHLQQFHLSPGVVGLVFTSLTGSYAIFSFVLGVVNKRFFYPKLQLLFGFVMYIVSFLFIGPISLFHTFLHEPSLWSICLCLCGIGIAASSINIVVFKDSLDQARQDGYPDNFNTFGLVSGLYQFFHTMGGFLGPTIFSGLVESRDFPWACAIYAAVMATVAIVIICYIPLEDALQRLVNARRQTLTDKERLPLIHHR